MVIFASTTFYISERNETRFNRPGVGKLALQIMNWTPARTGLKNMRHATDECTHAEKR